MTPEMQSEVRKREEHKAYVNHLAMVFACELIRWENLELGKVPETAYDLAQEMAKFRAERELEPML